MDESRYRDAERRLWASVGATPSERRITLERNDATVRVQEVGAGPAILFVHGANTSGASWVTLAARLDGLRCILLDRPGTGLSEPLATSTDAASLSRFAETLIVDVLDALHLESAHLVAASLGGYIGLRSAAAYPDRIDRMVQFGWPAGALTNRVPTFMRVMAVPGLSQLIATMPPSERTVRATFRRIGHGASLDAGRITQDDLDTYLALLRYTDTMRNELALGRALVSPVHGVDPMLLPDAVLAKVVTPTLFIWGANDPFGDTTSARRLVSRLPDARLELMAGAGHAPWLDDLDHAVGLTRRFFDP